MAERQTFNVQKFLSAQGGQIDRIEDGVFAVGTDPETGEEFKFSPRKYLESQGIRPQEVDIAWNTPDNALPQSPLSIGQRAAIQFGNAKGIKTYLKNNFQDVGYDEENGLVVKEGDVWKQVDPSAFGSDPWTISEAIKDTVDLADEALLAGGATAGAVGAGATTFGAATVGGAAAGGAAAETFRSSLGRILGTYEATPVEQLKDIGIEAALAAGGETIAIGARVAAPQVKAALKKLGGGLKGGAKRVFVEALGRTSGAGAGPLEYAIENPDAVANRFSQLKRLGDTAAEVQVNLVPRIEKKADAFLEQTSQGLSKKFGEALEITAKAAEKKAFKVDMRVMANEALAGIEEKGLGQIVRDSNGKASLRRFTAEQLRARGGAAEVLSPSDYRALNSVVRAIDDAGSFGTLRGKAAINVLSKTNSSLNRAFSKMQKDPQLRYFATQADDGWQNALTARMREGGLDTEWAQGQKLYNTYGKVVKEARKLRQSPNGAALFAERLVNDSRAGIRAQGMAQQLLELAPNSKALQEDLMQDLVAARFLPWISQEGFLGAQLGVGGAASIFYEPALGASLLAASSPRVVGASAITSGQLGQVISNASKIVPYSYQSMSFLRRMSPAQRRAFLSDEMAIRTWFQLSQGAAQQEEAMLQEIVGGALGQ